MTICCSINLNKRWNHEASKLLFMRWLSGSFTDLLCVQEPWLQASRSEVDFPDFMAVGGNERVFSWAGAGIHPPCHQLVDTFCQRVQLGSLVIFNVYMDAHKAQTRVSQVRRVQELVSSERGQIIVVVGDFNLAPLPADGIYGGEVARYTSRAEREALQDLLVSCSLVDLGAPPKLREWTLERRIREKMSQYRCDLALVSKRIAPLTLLRYDHAVRVRGQGFTDHSALILDIPNSDDLGADR